MIACRAQEHVGTLCIKNKKYAPPHEWVLSIEIATMKYATTVEKQDDSIPI
jgi:hypothetical protein